MDTVYHIQAYLNKVNFFRGTWVAQSIEHLTLVGFGSGHDLRVLGWSPTLGSKLSTDSGILSLSLCASSLLVHTFKRII